MPIILSAPAKRKNARKASGGFDLYFGKPSPQTWAGTFATREQARHKADELTGEYGDPSHGVHIVAARAPAKRKNTRKAALPPMRNNGSRTTTKSVSVGDRVRVLPAYRHHDKKSAARWTGVVTEKYAGGDFSVEFSDGEEGVYKASEVSSVSARRNGSRSVVDAVAARELELYIENEASLIGPGNTLGANIMRMLAGRIVRGTYDGTKAWKAWVPLATEGAKRYKREIGSLNASKATRDAVATRLSEAFESEVRSGALNPLKLLGK